MENKDWLERTQLLVGEEAIEQLKQSNILLVGLGGVGSYAAEFLCRAGIGKMTIIDGDVVDITNINRQLPALRSTVGVSKAAVVAARLKDINPELELTVIEEFLLPDRMKTIVAEGYDYALDCIDSIQPKMNLIMSCLDQNVPIIASMGAGGRIDPSKVKITKLSKTHNCPLAQQIRKGLRRKRYRTDKVMAVFSEETVERQSLKLTDGTNFKRSFYGTISYIPALFGLNMASYIVRKRIGKM